jgi:hypothetical protein
MVGQIAEASNEEENCCKSMRHGTMGKGEGGRGDGEGDCVAGSKGKMENEIGECGLHYCNILH